MPCHECGQLRWKISQAEGVVHVAAWRARGQWDRPDHFRLDGKVLDQAKVNLRELRERFATHQCLVAGRG